MSAKKAAVQRIKDFMRPLGDGEHIDADATQDQAIHQLVVGGYQSLLVRREGAVVGLLRLPMNMRSFPKPSSPVRSERHFGVN